MYRLLLEYIETFNEDFPLSKLGRGYSEYEVCGIITNCLTLNKSYSDVYEPPKEADATDTTATTDASGATETTRATETTETTETTDATQESK